MRDTYHQELGALTDRLVEMTRLTQTAIGRATQALLSADLQLAEEVISGDQEVNQLHAEIEASTLELMARQQPVAKDLRMLVAALRMSADLERMGDLAVHIAEVARRHHPEPAVPEELRPTIEEMGQIAGRLVAKAGVVIDSRDVAAGLEVEKDDDAMDRLRRDQIRGVLGPQWTHGVEAAVDIALVGRYYERFADHAVHVANDVVYFVTGQHRKEINSRL